MARCFIPGHSKEQWAVTNRFILYSFDNGTLGHARRTLNIATALSNHCDDALIMLVGSADLFLTQELPARVDYLRLPAVSRESFERARYVSSKWGDGDPWFWKMRSDILRDVFMAFEPTAIIVDYKAPGISGELVAGLQAVKSNNSSVRTFCGIRDWPDSPDRAIRKWKNDGTYELFETVYDEVIVYGSPDVFDIVPEYKLPRDRTYYAGYIMPEPLKAGDIPGGLQQPRVLVTGGGGSYLQPLVESVLAAWDTLPDCERPVIEILPGPYCGKSLLARLTKLSDTRIKITSTVVDARERMIGASLVITQGGYNSLIEALSLGIRPLVLPRMASPGADINMEQYNRTERFAELGLVDMIRHGEDTLDTIALALKQVGWQPDGTREPPDPGALAMVCRDGAGWFAHHLVG